MDVPAKPAAHLRSGVSSRECHDVEIRIDPVDELESAAFVEPCQLLPRSEPKGDCRVENQGKTLPFVVVRSGVANLYRSAFDRIQHLQPGNDLPGGRNVDLEIPIRH